MTAGEKRRASTGDKEEEERLQKQARGSEGGGSDDQPQKQEVLTADRPKSESPEGKGPKKGASGQPQAGDRAEEASEGAATATAKAKAAEQSAETSDDNKAEGEQGDTEMAEAQKGKDGKGKGKAAAEKGDADMSEPAGKEEAKASPAKEAKGTPKGKGKQVKGDKAGSGSAQKGEPAAEEGRKEEAATGEPAGGEDQKGKPAAENKKGEEEEAAEGGGKGEPAEGESKKGAGVKEEAEDDDSMYEAYSTHQQQGDEGGEEVISSVKADTILEKGRITFFYRPKVQQEHPESIDDVQRFHLVLHPTARAPALPEAVEQAAERAEKEGEGVKLEQEGEAGKSEGHVVRLITIGKKKLPDISRHERMFAFVTAVGKSVEDVTSGLGEKEYETATRGKRLQPAARVVASGVYTICLKERGAKKGRAANETVLAYELELPGEGHEGPVQKELNIGHTGTYHIQVKNPEIQGSVARSEGAPTTGPGPQYTATQMALFHGRRWMGALDVGMLDQQGAELLIIGARPTPADEVDQAAAEELKETVKADEAQAAAAVEGPVSKKQKTSEEEGVAERVREEVKGAKGVEEAPAKTGQWA